MKRPMSFAIVALLAVAAGAGAQTPFRPPATPLVTHNPFLSIWSAADHLNDSNTVHWTRREHSLLSMIKVDGDAYRLMGADPLSVPPMPQTGLEVTPTRSIFHFRNAKVGVTLTFFTAALPNDLDALSMPLTYVTWQVRSVDGAKHNVQIYDSTDTRLAVNRPEEPVRAGKGIAGPLTFMRAGTVEQPVLRSAGDDHRINWGYAYVATANAYYPKAATGDNGALLANFAKKYGEPVDASQPQPPASDTRPVMAFTFDLGNVGAQNVTRQVIVAYDEIYSIKYFGQKLRPYWRRNGATPESMLRKAHRDYPALLKRAIAFDRELTADATKAGGAKYAQMCALAYRQALTACGLAADSKGKPLFFTKENTSNGDIATVDVFFPMDPMLILLSPTLAKATLVSVLDYSASSHWKFPSAPHDLGTYPLVFGRDDGGEGMPVEESGNMLILCDAIAQADGNAKFVTKWWPQLTQWAKYLERYGLDPENQLCTDDFMGHLAHNANLSIKAILGLAAYGDLCKMRGDKVTAARYAGIARVDAKHWIKASDDGDHSRLAFDKPGTWSQKYNLAWDRILGLNVFPPSVARKEVAYYKTMIQRYGVPLDSRTRLTKADWSVWSATLAEKKSDFETIIAPIYDYLNETTAHSPFADSYGTDDVNSVGMHARPVIGGVFIKMLADRPVWLKWARRDKTVVNTWAPLPKTPRLTITEIVPTSRKAAQTWRYTTEQPGADWMKPEFDASAWTEGPAGFGTAGTPGITVRTNWNTSDIWIRREVTMPANPVRDLQFLVYHDEDVDIYINGIPAASETSFTTEYIPVEISRFALALLKPGATVTLAAHCHQTAGGQGVDVGIAKVVVGKAR
ncbi:MAG TPA: DUF4965 domain-containing protein [Armatimonadota bacterium]